MALEARLQPAVDAHLAEIVARLNQLPAGVGSFTSEQGYLTIMRHLTLPAIQPSHALRVQSDPHTQSLRCGDPRYAKVFNGRRRTEPALILDFIPFGYDIDLLEVRMLENYDHVDAFVVYEAEYTQRGLPKPVCCTSK